MGNVIVERGNALCRSVFQLHIPGSLCARKTNSVLSSASKYILLIVSQYIIKRFHR